MAYSLECHPTKNIGVVDIMVAVPFNGTLLKLGTATDHIQIENRPYFLDVPGDRNGGHQGPPIERQYLGEVEIVQFSLSSFTLANIRTLQARAHTATLGKVLQTEVGAFNMTAKAVRLLLDTPTAGDVKNYWCAVPIMPYQVGYGTKYMEWVFGFECHRPPCGHPKADIIWDTNNAAYV